MWLCLSLPCWLMVVAVADGSFAFGMLIITLILGGQAWPFGFNWLFVSLAVLGAVLSLVSIALIVAGWDQDTGKFLSVGIHLRFGVQILLISNLLINLYSTLHILGSLLMTFLYLGMFWPNWQAIARAWQLETGSSGFSLWDVMRCRAARTRRVEANYTTATA